MRKIKILITGGGTGGHTSPAISVVKYLRKSESDVNTKFDILYVGSKLGIEKNYAKKENIPYKSISTGKLRRRFSLKNIADMFKVGVGLLQSLGVVRKFKPDIIFSTGGYVSVPPVMAGGMFKVPVIIHEQTVNMGLANKIASKFATKVALTFESSKEFFPQSKVIVTGIPLREEIFMGDSQKCFNTFSLDPNIPLLYITGGSQGSKFINDNIKQILPELLKYTNIIHQCGGKAIHDSFQELKSFKEMLPNDLKQRYVVRDYIYDELPDIFKACTMILGRSGAGTVNECIALGKASVFIPLPGTTKDEQGENARLAKSLGGAEVLYQKDITSDILLDKLKEIILDEDKRNLMSSNFMKERRINANDEILKLILENAKK